MVIFVAGIRDTTLWANYIAIAMLQSLSLPALYAKKKEKVNILCLPFRRVSLSFLQLQKRYVNIGGPLPRGAFFI